MPRQSFPQRVEYGRDVAVAFLVLVFRIFAAAVLLPPLWRAVIG